MLFGYAFLQRYLSLIGFRSHLLPECLLILGFAEFCLSRLKLFGGLVMGSLILLKNLAQSLHFGAQLFAFIFGRSWWNKWAGFVRRIFEGAVIPKAQLPSHLQSTQRASMVTFESMAGGISSTPHLTKELCNFTRKDSAVLQATQQVVLSFFWNYKLARPRSNQLGQQL